MRGRLDVGDASLGADAGLELTKHSGGGVHLHGVPLSPDLTPFTTRYRLSFRQVRQTPRWDTTTLRLASDAPFALAIPGNSRRHCCSGV